MAPRSFVRPNRLKARPPRLKRGEVRVVALKQAAAQVFVSRGYDAATMTEIASRAHAPIGSLYQFFPTKASLAAALHDDLLAVLSEMLEELRERAGERMISLADSISRMLRRLAEFLDLHPEFIVLLERRDLDKDRKRATRALMQRHIVALFSQATQPLRRRRAEIMAVVMLEMMKVLMTRSAADEEELHGAARAELRGIFAMYLQSHIAT
jgi:AcrR family transcriptional regulator